MSRVVRRIAQSIWDFAKWVASSLFWAICGYVLWNLAKPTVCAADETTLSCLRQWQSVLSALIALAVSSVGWKLSQASIAQSVKLATFNRLEVLGDRYDEDFRALQRFQTNLIAARTTIEFHLDGRIEDLSQHQKRILEGLSFPTWPVPSWENYLNHCLDEWREHYYKAAQFKADKRTSDGDYKEHRARIKGIFDHLISELRLIEKQRLELYNREFRRLS